MEAMNTLFTCLRIAVGAGLLAIGGFSCGDSQTSGPVVTGNPCAVDGDCASGQSCGFPTANGCTAQGVCLVYPTPGTAHCNSVILACGCSGSQVGIPCDYPSGYAPAKIKSGSAALCP